MSVNSKMTAIANEIRELSGTTGTMGLDAMATRVGEANDEVGSQVNLISQIQTALQGKAAGSGGGNSELVKQIIDGTATEVSDSSVESIIDYAFDHCRSLTTVNFPACTTIGPSAFAYCPSLTTVSFPAATSIGSYAFASCTSLTTVSFPAAMTIDNKAFAYCSLLTTVSFPACTTIGCNAFDDCSRLTTVSFPVATTISDSAFERCSRLTTVSFSAATSIGGGAFGSCYSLTTVSFPVATTIGSGTFGYCSSLTTVSFPAAMTIGYYAFQFCRQLSDIFLAGRTVCALSHSNAFSSTPFAGYSTYFSGNPYIYVPSSLIASYQAATNWTYYSSRFSAIENSPKWDGEYGGADISDNTIYFLLCGTQYLAETGMTFADWVNSSYNVDGYTVKGTRLSDPDGFPLAVFASDVIEHGGNYG